MSIPLNIGGKDGLDVQTRVVLTNETQHKVISPGMAGKVTLIGAFPSADSEIYAVTSYAEYLATYKITNEKEAEEYDAHRAIKRIFMEGIEGYRGATSVTCININTAYPASNSITIENVDNLNSKIVELENDISRYTSTLERLRREKAEYENRIEELQSKDTLTSDERDELATTQEHLADSISLIAEYQQELINASSEYDAYSAFQGYYSDEYGIVQMPADGLLTFKKLKDALKKIADDDTDMIFISSDLHDCIKRGKSDASSTAYDTTQAPNLGVVYDELLDFIDNEYTNHRPLTYIGHIRTADVTTDVSYASGITSGIIDIDSGKTLNLEAKDEDYGVGYGDTNWGAKQIAELFTRENNELSTCGLFYQGGTINGEKVDAMQVAAHICGWLAGMNVSEDLTYRTIPGLTSINKEVYFGKGDEGTLINNLGIQVIRPKDRLAKTFYVNNSVMPTGWHTNHVRSVIYLLKQYEFEAGLGINNITSNIEAFQTSLETVSKSVMQNVEVIRSVTIGDIEVLNHYHIYVPIDIVLAGVVTKISVGVSMELDEEGTAGTTLTTTGYNFYYY